MPNKTTTELIKDFLFESFQEEHRCDVPPNKELDNFQFIKKNRFGALLFLNPKTEELLELNNEYGHVDAYGSRFDEIVIKKIDENSFFCMNCWENDLEILKYKMKQYGIKNFKIEEDKEATKNLESLKKQRVNGEIADYNDYKNEDVYNLTFRSNSDCAAFQLYFQDYIDAEEKSE